MKPHTALYLPSFEKNCAFGKNCWCRLQFLQPQISLFVDFHFQKINRRCQLKGILEQISKKKSRTDQFLFIFIKKQSM